MCAGRALRRTLAFLGACAVLVIGFLSIARPWYRTWGATAQEVERSLPGDRIAPAPASRETRAITIRAPNIEALFADGEHLLLVEPGDDRDLADAIARFMDDRELAARTAQAGRSRVLERHTWAAHAEQLASVFRAMMDERRAA